MKDNLTRELFVGVRRTGRSSVVSDCGQWNCLGEKVKLEEEFGRGEGFSRSSAGKVSHESPCLVVMLVDVTGLNLVGNMVCLDIDPNARQGPKGNEFGITTFQILTPLRFSNRVVLELLLDLMVENHQDLGRPQTPPDQESCGNKVDDTIAKSIKSTHAVGQTDTNEGMKESPDYKSGINSLHSSLKEFEDKPLKLSKSVDLAIEGEDCPICLEEYDEENPRIITKYEHYFHLSCILKWMERSDTCPVYDQETIFQHNVNM
ncbi:hypothetical protein GIB67_028512 [Kingdonia uniflora]|uniref:RING-type E3 ubiquitin transferase n=1 Tax=Kingdonia uniflora TaxID=39325 RepID=A0A7J7KVV8_9MAGN|nr:hypothetical protein GIB67_028512 [Kingdonia uniflora]